ncbi:TPA: hypothetical protein SLN67_003532 [Serratia marcescens]|nr:hypothetical protein [Serratia marcescens]
MASISVDASFVTIEEIGTLLPNPPMENRFGEVMYVFTFATFVRASSKHSLLSTEQLLMLLSLLPLGVIALISKVIYGGFMAYIPLYLALSPVFYWIIKILYAFSVAKLAHPLSLTYSQHDSEGNIVVKEITNDQGKGFLDATIGILNHEGKKHGR